MSRPIVAIDVDGVLNVKTESPHMISAWYDGSTHTGESLGGWAYLHPHHGELLCELITAGVELVWNTAWGTVARDWLAPLIGLPTNLHVIEHTACGVRFGHQAKLDALYTWAENRPLAVLDDEFGGKDDRLARDRSRNVAPTIHVSVDPHRGLHCIDVDVVHLWLGRMSRRTES